MHESQDLVRQLLAGKLGWETEKKFLQRVLQEQPERLGDLVHGLAEHRHRQAMALEEAKRITERLKQLNDALTALPWFPATVVRKSSAWEDKVVVASGRTSMLVGCADGVRAEQLRVGQPVFLAQEKNCIVGVDSDPPHCGETAVVERLLGDQEKIVLKVREMEEVVAGLSDDLREQPPQEGDRVIFDREHLMALEIIPKKEEGRSLLEEVETDVTFEQIGGLDDVIDEVLTEISLPLFHQDVVQEHQLRAPKGITLVSPPGCGKTKFAKALANFVKSMAPDDSEVRFLSFTTGSHRVPLYGATDHRIIQAFDSAKGFTRMKKGNKVLMFFDELDNWGRRSAEVGNTIDSRVLDTFLSQIDGVHESADILLIGASNRADDLVDTALMRPGRFGDKIFRIPRPGREAARDIFSKYLLSSLPYRANGRKLSGEEAAEQLIGAAVSQIFAPQGGANKIATLVMRDGTRRDILASDVVSGAIIENIVRRAKYQSCVRALCGEAGITLEDVLEAVDAEFESAARGLKSPRNARDILGLSSDMDIVRVELESEKVGLAPRAHRFVRQ